MQRDEQGRLVIDINVLRERSLYVATPMYGGFCTGLYSSGLNNLSQQCLKLGIKYKNDFIYNESLITRARNYLVDNFMRSDYTHFMFIDADIAFNYEDVLALLALADPNSDKDVVCGVYPKKNISWEKIVKAVNKGLGDEDPEILAAYAGDFVFAVEENGEYSMNDLIPVSESGTGFMMIQKRVFEKFTENFPEYLYYPDHKRSEDFDGSRQITAYFMDPLWDMPDGKKRHLSEDYFFCRKIKEIGMRTWIAPWMKLHHLGSYIYVGDLPGIIGAGLHATLDPEDYLKKKNKK